MLAKRYTELHANTLFKRRISSNVAATSVSSILLSPVNGGPCSFQCEGCRTCRLKGFSFAADLPLLHAGLDDCESQPKSMRKTTLLKSCCLALLPAPSSYQRPKQEGYLGVADRGSCLWSQPCTQLYNVMDTGGHNWREASSAQGLAVGAVTPECSAAAQPLINAGFPPTLLKRSIFLSCSSAVIFLS